MKTTPRSTLWIALNLGGMLFYLHVASELWVQPGEEGMPGGAGDPFYWLFFIVPILLVYTTVNTFALAAIVRRVLRTGNKQALLIWLVVGGLWLTTVAYDHHRAYRVVDPECSQAAAAARDA